MTTVPELSSSARQVARVVRAGRRRMQHAFEQVVVRRLAATVVVRRTGNFSTVHWLGRPMWQNVTDAFLLQETVVECDIDLVVECGTNRGGSAFFLATIFDQRGGDGHVVTIDVESLVDFEHPRITFLVGSSVDSEVVDRVRDIVAARRPRSVLVILDSDHRRAHVLREALIYADFVTPGSYLFVQDGIIDELPMMRRDRPGPLRAVEEFLRRDPRFSIDRERSERYLIGHSPAGWLRRGD
jgi:cephalosporin hydroxylase